MTELIPMGSALAAFKELTELAVGDLETVAGLCELINVGDTLFRADHCVTMGAGRAAVFLEPSDRFYELLAAARIRARNRQPEVRDRD
jgi:hypothetical protein